MVTARVVPELLGMLVAGTIHFNCRSRGRAVEIKNIRTNGMLAKKLQSIQAIAAQFFSENYLR